MLNATIVDVLNEDCWGLVLGLLRTEDIIRSERVSRGWQRIILRYLGEACFSIEYPWYSHEATRKYRILKMSEDDLARLTSLTAKWGPCVKKADCVSGASLKVLRRNCPNLEDVTFYGLQNSELSNGSPKTFKSLKRVQFRGCESVRARVPRRYVAASDQCFAFCALAAFIFKYYFTNSPHVHLQVTDTCIKHWLGRESVEQLAVWGCERVTGQGLATPPSSKLKGVCLKECEALEFRHLLSAADHWTGLRKLELIHVPKEIFLNVHRLLDKLPDLEELCLRWEKRMGLGGALAASVARLRLRRLDVSRSPDVDDAWLAAAAHGFGRLAALHLEGYHMGVTARGVLAACGAAGGALRELNIASNRGVEDRHVEEILRTCPNLERLDVSFCWHLTEGVVARAGAATQPRRLRLVVESTMVEGFQQERYPWLLLDFGD